MSDTIALVGLLLGILTFIGGLITWYRGAIEKGFAAKRAFEHLQRNYEQIGATLASGGDEMEDISRCQSEILEKLRSCDQHLNDLARIQVEQKAYLIGISNQLSGIFARVDGGRSTGWGRESQ